MFDSFYLTDLVWEGNYSRPTINKQEIENKKNKDQIDEKQSPEVFYWPNLLSY